MSKEATKTRQERARETWKQYEEGRAYLASISLDSTIKQNINFYEGRQWAAPTPSTKLLPRPVTNIVRMIANNKMSAMNNKPCKIVYEADSSEQDSTDFTKFSDYQFKEMGMDRLNRRAAYNGCLKGSYMYHIYWDAEARGKKGKVTGAMRAEILDPRNVIFCNPAQIDEQKQKYIIVAVREEVEAVKEALPKGYDKDYIKADNDDDGTKKEQDGTEMCTVLIKYFKKDGEVYCEKSVRDMVIRDAFPLRPDYEQAKRDLFKEADEANGDSPDDTEDTEKAEPFSTYKPTLYPIAVGQYIEREDSIYGLSEVEGLIPNQKSINLTNAMILLQVQNESWSKWIVRADALKGQQITNESGQVLTDHSATGDGIKRVGGGQFNTAAMNFLDNLINTTRVVTGSTEVMSGEVISANMSGAAIAQLQAQAQQPMEETRKAFWRVQEKVGRIAEQFYRMYYHTPTEFKTQEIGKDGTPTISSNVFEAAKYENVEFSVIAKITAGTASSPAGDIAVLDQLKAEGVITTQQWLDAYPNDALSDKNQLLDMVKQAEVSKLMQIESALAEREQQLKVALEQNKAATTALASVQQTNNENEQLRQDLAIIFNKYRQSQNNAMTLKEFGDEAHSDASMFAQELASVLGRHHIGDTEEQPI